ncbi:Sterol regulatory element-binding protein 2 [Coemansia sp. RSA 1933]|nr:Sterol regulatory element-binding protein 2 [Coemansia sp. RSA 1933]
MKYSHSHRSQSHRFAGYDYINGPNPDMLSYSAQQNHTAASATASSSSPSSAVPGSATAGASYLLEGRPLTAEEKELKRKVSHSAIEKRRRERTNTVLRELQGIIPSLSKSGKIQKLEILEAAAEYIRDLTTAPKPANEAETSSLHSETLGSTKSRGNRLGCSQEYGSNFGNFQLPRTCAETTSLETVLEQQQHPAVATPMSVSSNASNDDSSDDALANKLPKAASSSPDPCSMKVDFLLCQE